MVIYKETLTDLIDFIYLNLIKNSENVSYIVVRTILTFKNIDIETILDLIINRFSDEAYIYINADSIDLIENNHSE